jgi:Ca2+-binding RTX toxin-like protein
LHLTNLGTIDGGISGAPTTAGPSDVVINPGHINGDVFLRGSTIFNGKGGTSGPIHVGRGNATITGGTGAVRFVFDSGLAGQVTKITNFTLKDHDTIVLSERDFPKIGHLGKLDTSHIDIGAATHSHPEIVYDQANGFLFYDSNGSAHGGLHHFATLTSHPILTVASIHASFVVEA